LVERLIRNVLILSRLHVFSATYCGIGRAKRHHSGVVGKVLGKELGKEFLFCANALKIPSAEKRLALRLSPPTPCRRIFFPGGILHI
jgi:hypothetical protein